MSARSRAIRQPALAIFGAVEMSREEAFQRLLVPAGPLDQVKRLDVDGALNGRRSPAARLGTCFDR